MENLGKIKNIWDLKSYAEANLTEEIFSYLEGGADDKKTLQRNNTAFDLYQIRPRRLVDVSTVHTKVNIFGKEYSCPIAIAPLGVQKLFHPEGELATARAAKDAGILMTVSTVANHSYEDILTEIKGVFRPWFQLYPTNDRTLTKKIVQGVEDLGCEVLILTIDVPVLGNRENSARQLLNSIYGNDSSLGNLGSITKETTIHDASLDWSFINWLKEISHMKIVLKGILTAEDTMLALQHGVDGIIVSNHGGRQLESNLSTIEALEEVFEVTQGQVPLFLDGGIRRGTDIFKAIALGADAIFIGRAFCYGLATAGQLGVDRAIKILYKELVRNMRLAGTPSIEDINRQFVRKAPLL